MGPEVSSGGDGVVGGRKAFGVDKELLLDR